MDGQLIMKSEEDIIMYERKNYLKRAFYHLMKIEMKINQAVGYEGYEKDNAKLNELFSAGDGFESSQIYIEDEKIHVGPYFFGLPEVEQDALIDYFSQELEDAEEE